MQPQILLSQKHLSSQRNQHQVLKNKSSLQMHVQSQEQSDASESSSGHSQAGSDENQLTHISYQNMNHRPSLEKNICRHFAPFTQYFTSILKEEQKETTTYNNRKQKFKYLLYPQPIFRTIDSLQQKINLSIPKQLEYLRGSVKSHIDENLIRSIMKEDSKTNGWILHEGNKSIIIQHKKILIYGHKNYLKSIHLNQLEKIQGENNQNLSSQIYSPKIITQFKQAILEVQILCEFPSLILIIRTKSHICIFSFESGQVIEKMKFKPLRNNNQLQQEGKLYEQFIYDYQITTMEVIPLSHSVNFAIYSNKQQLCSLYRWQINMLQLNKLIQNKQVRTKNKKSFTHKRLLYRVAPTSNYAIAIKTLNPRELLIGFHHKIVIVDTKDNCVVQQLLTTSNMNSFNSSNMFCGVELLNNNQYCTSKFIVSDHKYLSIYDIRLINKTAIKKCRHRCQQSPPNILQMKIFETPIVLAHSSNNLSSALLLELNQSGQFQSKDSPLMQKLKMISSRIPKNVQLFNDNLFFENLPLAPNTVKNITNNPLLLYSSNISYYHDNIYPESLSLFHLKNRMIGILQVDNCEGVSLQYLTRNQYTHRIHRFPIYNQSDQINERNKNDLSLNWVQNKIVQPYINSSLSRNSNDDHSSEEDYSRLDDCTEKGLDRKINYMTMTKFYTKIKQLAKEPQQNSLLCKQKEQFQPTFDNSLIINTQQQGSYEPQSHRQQLQRLKSSNNPNQIQKQNFEQNKKQKNINQNLISQLEDLWD